MVDERVKKYFHDAEDILNSLNIEYGPIRNVTVNSRVKSRWGRCTYSKTEEVFDIEISAILLKGDYKAIMDTVLHELLHANKKRLCHTGEWKSCANIVNKNYGYNIKRAVTAAEKNIDIGTVVNYKYLVICNKCGETNKYARKGKVIKLLMRDPENSCKCGICNGKSFTLKEL